MAPLPNLRRLAFFTRLLDEAPPAERYRLAAEQIVHAERFFGFDRRLRVAQHHFHEHEGGGLPSPFVFLSQIVGLHIAHPPPVQGSSAASP